MTGIRIPSELQRQVIPCLRASTPVLLVCGVQSSSWVSGVVGEMGWLRVDWKGAVVVVIVRACLAVIARALNETRAVSIE